jgi:hypothetical protein
MSNHNNRQDDRKMMTHDSSNGGNDNMKVCCIFIHLLIHLQTANNTNQNNHNNKTQQQNIVPNPQHNSDNIVCVIAHPNNEYILSTQAHVFILVYICNSNKRPGGCHRCLQTRLYACCTTTFGYRSLLHRALGTSATVWREFFCFEYTHTFHKCTE